MEYTYSLSEFTDAFRFYQGAYENQLLRAENINEGLDEVYYVECRDGEVGIWKFRYGIQDAEEIA
jgi:hypothetical protein